MNIDIDKKFCSCSYQSFHPPSPINLGETFIKGIYEAVRNSPQWNTTLFILTFDEHGGFGVRIVYVLDSYRLELILMITRTMFLHRSTFQPVMISPTQRQHRTVTTSPSPSTDWESVCRLF